MLAAAALALPLLAQTPSADLEVTLSASANPAVTGENVTFTLTATNHGPDAATGVSTLLSPGAREAFVSASAGCTLASGLVACDVGSLAAGASSTATIVLRPSVMGPSTMLARVSAATADPVGANNLAYLIVDVNAASHLANLSTRMRVLTRDNVLIAGFIIDGTADKTVVVRARGPSLATAGVTGVLADPTLRLVRSADHATIATNDDWQTDPGAATLSRANMAPSSPLESAMLVTLAPGAYTAIVEGKAGGTGVGLVEVFDYDHPEFQFVNISTRGMVLTGNDVMIGGFVIYGSGPKKLVVRARGPSLANFSVQNALANPVLRLVRSSDGATIATNDDWQSSSDAAALNASGFAPTDPLEAAMLVTLQPGAYTAIVTGAGGGTGVGIVEVFAQ